MKYFILSLFFSLISSCSHYSHKERRAPANSTLKQYFTKFKEESARYILRYEPRKYGNIEKILSDEQALYSLLGKIDLNQVSPIHSRLTGKEDYHQKNFLLKKVNQISYQQWLEILPQVIDSYIQGQYVFYYKGHYYSLSGLKMSINNLNKQIFKNAKKNNLEDFDEHDLAINIFNRKMIYPLNEVSALVVANGRLITLEQLNDLTNDFRAQVGKSISLTPQQLINYNYKSPPLETGSYQIYRNKKYRSFINNQELLDSSYACKTKFYSRSLSRNQSAQIFISTLLEHKESLMKDLELSNNQYDELMRFALGVFAVESKMDRSTKYIIKERIEIGDYNLGQMAITLLKKLKGRSDDNSRGLTQIKNISRLLKNSNYEYLKHSNLDDPKNAALATMFVLREKLGYLRHFSHLHNNITDQNWIDYLYYFYQGSSAQITKGLATPPLNLRIQKILEVKDSTMIFTNCD